MTTIAWDGRTVAGDNQARSGNYRCPQGMHKIRRVGDRVYAVTGSAPLVQPMIEWHQKGAKPADIPQVKGDSYCRLIVFEKGRCYLYTSEIPYPDEYFAPNAWGSGDDFAIGAMHAGADAKRAIEIAIVCNPDTGGDVKCIDLAFQTQKQAA